MSLGDTLLTIGLKATFGKSLMKKCYEVTYSDILKKIRQQTTSGVLRRHFAKNKFDSDIRRHLPKN